MLVLFETAAGYAVFKLLDEKVLKNPDEIFKSFQDVEDANKVVKLKHFCKFEDTTQALAAATALTEGKMSSDLKKLMKKIAKETQEEMLVADAKLGNAIKDKFDIPCVYSTPAQELMRGIRSQLNSLIGEVPAKEMAAFALGLAHSLSRYKLKFSPDKVDTMIVQAVSLLDDIDKELNNYNMRCREWYGWHFPELSKIVTDHVAYAKLVMAIGHRTNALNVDLKEILPEELESEVKEAAEISMGSEVSDEDITNITHLCAQILDMQDYRAQLFDYLKNRMYAIAPNLTVLVGELIGARLISHAGSLMNLAKHPSSTIQILGAEKALFRALKTKHDTPKYGLIYHASLVGQSNQKLKGKVSRMLAAKAALACRVDALGESTDAELGAEHKANLEARLKMLETGNFHKLAGRGKKKADMDKYTNKAEVKVYNSAQDSTLPVKREAEDEPEAPKPKKKKSKKSLGGGDEAEPAAEEETTSPKKKKKKVKTEEVKEEPKEPEEEEATTPKPKKKKKKTTTEEEEPEVEVKSEKKKKKKKVKVEAESD